MDARVVECVEENISKTNDHATRSISRQPYGKSFRVIITTLVMCFYLCNLPRAEKNDSDTANKGSRVSQICYIKRCLCFPS